MGAINSEILLLPSRVGKSLTPDQLSAIRNKTGKIPFVINTVYLDNCTGQGLEFTPRPERIQILYGGSGSGKSDYKATEFLISALTQPYFRLMFSRKHAEQIRDSQFLLFKGLIKRYGIEEYFQVKENEMDIICRHNGNLLMSAGLDDVDKIKSIPDVTDIWLEEPLDRKGSIQATDFTELNRRLRCPQATNHIHLTFNPISIDTWIYDYFFKDDTYDCFRLKTTYRDNDFSPPEYAEQFAALKEKDPQEWDIYANGSWGDARSDNVIFSNEAISDMFTNSFLPKTGVRRMAADIAFEGKDEMIVLVIDGWVLIDIKVYSKTSPKQVVEILQQTANDYNIPGRRIVYDAGGNGGAYLKDYFLSTAIPFTGASPAIMEADLNDVQKKVYKRGYFNLRSQCFFRFANRIQNNRFYFGVKSIALQEQTRKELRATKKMDQPAEAPLRILKKEDIKAALHGASPGIADALSMLEIFDLIPEKIGGSYQTYSY